VSRVTLQGVALLACWSLAGRAAEDGPLGLADLAAYRSAIEPARPGVPEPRPASFRDLWSRPDDFRNGRVAVAGRVERVFHQGAVGEFPALAEVWIVDGATDPICLVSPEAPDKPAPKPGDSIRFEGTFLRRIRYRGGDVERLAPLVVGPGPARIERAAPAEPAASSSPFGGVFVAVLGGIVVLALLRAHLRRPVTRPIVAGPPPEFQDGEPAGYDGGDTGDGVRG
jgi:hypothetical protein